MKRIILIIILFSIASCINSVIDKPDNLISEDKMVDIIYDISLLDAMKVQNTGQVNYLTTTELLKSKYKTDSLTFAKSSQYYASDYKKYKQMFEEVKQRLEDDTKKLSNGKSLAPNNEQGVVK
jgi:dihydroorotate dehydrogenase